MDPEEQQRRDHIRHWATFMVMHLEQHEADTPRLSYRESLERLRVLIDRELARTEGGSRPVPSLTGTA